ncbi:MAG TPA: serine hydrolase, partial [Polyangia bacterium]
ALFAKDFLAKVPPATVTAIFTEMYGKYGAVVGRQHTESKAGKSKFELTFAKGYGVPLTLVLDAAAPHLITGIWFGNPVRLAATLDEVVTELKHLPGRVSFLAAHLGPRGVRPLATLEPDRSLALGSGFKLYILGALLQEIEAGTRAWSQIVTLDARSFSLPSGFLQEWPAGSPLTLHTVASLMISRSDNTATDLLLNTLGRERVERQMKPMGVTAPARNLPFLTTGEMFKLKGDPTGKLTKAYLARDLAGRRAFLSSTVAAMKLDDVVPHAKPLAVDTLEWFASAADMVRALAWLRDHTGDDRTSLGRKLLAVNPGIALPKQRWRYVGYKGGSEPGVLSMSFLLQATDGQWYALSAIWNNAGASVDTEKLVGLLGRAAQLMK